MTRTCSECGTEYEETAAFLRCELRHTLAFWKDRLARE